MNPDIDHLRTWIGKAEAREDQVTPTPVAALAATLDRDVVLPRDGDPLPPLWHWLYFLPIFPLAQSGPDGHPTRGGFLPPVPLPRRMWAGSRFEFLRPLHVGDRISRLSRIVDVTGKEGRSGSLVFVLVRHELSDGGGVALIEEHDIVYRDNPRPGESAPSPKPAPAKSQWRHRIEPTPVLLFRYSALTFNSHRIHYDRSYVTQAEGYPGLVVHGPLIATLLTEVLAHNLPQSTIAKFEFRAVRPLFDTSPFSTCGKPAADGRTVKLWAQDSESWLAMDATATLA